MSKICVYPNNKKMVRNTFCFTAETPAKNEKSTTSTPSQNNNQQRRGQKRKLKEDEPFVVHENGKISVLWMYDF